MLAYISWRVTTEVHLGPFMIRPHGVFIALGFLGGAWLLLRATRARGISDEAVHKVLTWGLIGGLAGMRLAWDLGHWREFDSPIELVAVWQGGMSLLGGLLGGIGLGALVARRERLPLLPMMDMAAPGLALGIA